MLPSRPVADAEGFCQIRPKSAEVAVIIVTLPWKSECNHICVIHSQMMMGSHEPGALQAPGLRHEVVIRQAVPGSPVGGGRPPRAPAVAAATAVAVAGRTGRHGQAHQPGAAPRL